MYDFYVAVWRNPETEIAGQYGVEQPCHGQLKGESMKIRKLYHPKTLKFCLELWIGWRSLKLTGFWFTDRIGK
jgi:hypothetical protein